MTIYWERCDFCGQNRPVKRCSIIPDFSVDIHCCVACRMWMDKCSTPAWKVEVSPIARPRARTLSSEDKKRLLDELTSMLEGVKPKRP